MTRTDWSKLATLWSVGTALILALTKGFAWQQSGSVAILASVADSLLDFLASCIAFIGVRMAAQPPDDNHRYGHEKAEAVSSLIQLILISGSAVFVLVEAIRHLATPRAIENSQFAVSVMVLSIVLTVILVAVQTIAVRRSGSMATESDRAHYIGDFLGNTGTLLAVVLAANFGLLRADGIAGLIAAGFLFWSVWEIGRRALPQLMDEEMGVEERATITRIALSDPDVLGVHAVRTRKAGATPYMQMHLELDPDIRLRTSHQIAERVQRRLLKEFPGADVIIHQDLHGQHEAHDEFGRPETADSRLS